MDTDVFVSWPGTMINLKKLFQKIMYLWHIYTDHLGYFNNTMKVLNSDHVYFNLTVR